VTAQPSLFADEPAAKPALTDRQHFALDAVTRQQDGLAAAEVGALWHQERGKHAAGVRCEWCTRDGTQLLKSLRKKGLIVRRRSGLWQSLAKPEAGGTVPPHAASGSANDNCDPATSDWPDGF
jgi:hypothetical protein